jgi:hypothetical protein
MLAVESSWHHEALFDEFMQGVSKEVKDEVVAWELPTDLESLIAFTFRIDGRLRERRMERKFNFARTSRDSTSPPSHTGNPRRSPCQEHPRFPDLPRESPKTAAALCPEPMQLGRAELLPAERLYMINTGSCQFCGTFRHFKSSCPVKEQAPR